MATILNNRKEKIVHVSAIDEETLQNYALEDGFDLDLFMDLEEDGTDEEADKAISLEMTQEIDLLVMAIAMADAEAAKEAAEAEQASEQEPEVPAEEEKTSEPEPEASPEEERAEEPEPEAPAEVESHPEPVAEVEQASEQEPEAPAEAKEKSAKPTLKERFRKLPYKKRIAAILVAELVLLASMGDNVFMTVELRNQLERQELRAAEAAEKVADNMLPVIPSSTGGLEKKGTDKINEIWIESIRDKAANLEYVEAERDYDIEDSETYKLVQGAYNWDGRVLSRGAGTVTGPNGKETYYNLNMSIIMRMMNARGVYDAYWVRSDGCKMIGNYIMVAADLDLHPRGSIVKTSLGLAMVCDTGSFTKHNRNQIDVAVAW